MLQRRLSDERTISVLRDDARRLRALEAQNNRLKLLLANAMLDSAALKELLSDALSEVRRRPSASWQSSASPRPVWTGFSSSDDRTVSTV